LRVNSFSASTGGGGYCCLGGLGAVFNMAVRTMLPESPRWLESRGRHAEAREVVESVAAMTAAGTPAPHWSEAAPPSSTDDDAPSVSQVLRIAFRDYRKRTVMLVIFQVLQTVAYYGFGTLAPLVLVGKGFEVTESLGYAALAFAGYPLGPLLSVPLVERFERKHLIIASAGNRLVRHRFRRIDESGGDRRRRLPDDGGVQHLLQRLPHLSG
jgi:MFS transporter, putative metabolite:H+ symporter